MSRKTRGKKNFVLKVLKKLKICLMTFLYNFFHFHINVTQCYHIINYNQEIFVMFKKIGYSVLYQAEAMITFLRSFNLIDHWIKFNDQLRDIIKALICVNFMDIIYMI